MLDKLIKINDLKLKSNLDDTKYQKKHTLIKEILADKNCFLKMDVEVAYAILRDLGIAEDDLKDTYLELIDIDKI